MSLKEFVPMEKIGEGSFASVYKVRRLVDQQVYALKKINMKCLDQKAKNNALNQIRLLACLSSPYIITYFQSFFQQKLDLLCIAMQYADEGDLYHLITRYKKQKKLIPEIQIWKILIHLLYGLKYLHEKKILHRDLKSQNIFISKGIYKIGDMNVSKINKHGLAITQTGTPYYASPQIWNDQPYDQKCDIWSLGCILFEMAALKPPFQGTNMEDLYNNITNGKISNIPKTYSNELFQIIKMCLKQNPLERPSSNDLLQNWTIKIYQNLCIDFIPLEDERNKQLLKTIYMPKYKSQLKKKLPDSNYKPNNQDKSQSKQKNQPLAQSNSQKKYLKENISSKSEQKLFSNNLFQKIKACPQIFEVIQPLQKKNIKKSLQNIEKKQNQIKISQMKKQYSPMSQKIELKTQSHLKQQSIQNNQNKILKKPLQEQNTNIILNKNIVCPEVLFQKVSIVKEQKQKINLIVEAFQKKNSENQYYKEKALQSIQRFISRKTWETKLWSFCLVKSVKKKASQFQKQKQETHKIPEQKFIKKVADLKVLITETQQYFQSMKFITQYDNIKSINDKKIRKRCNSLPKTQKINKLKKQQESDFKAKVYTQNKLKEKLKEKTDLNDIISRKINFQIVQASNINKASCKNQQKKQKIYQNKQLKSFSKQAKQPSSRKGIFSSHCLKEKENIKCVSSINEKKNHKTKEKNIVEAMANNLQQKKIEKQIQKYLFC